jgi:hypothetical protein
VAVNNNGQVVAFVKERLRRRAEIIMALKVLMEDDVSESHLFVGYQQRRRDDL